jgi:hypothetical protein
MNLHFYVLCKVTPVTAKIPPANADFLSVYTLLWSSGVLDLIFLAYPIDIPQWLLNNPLWTSCPLSMLLLPVCNSITRGMSLICVISSFPCRS